jgi:putative serine protease PepD
MTDILSSSTIAPLPDPPAPPAPSADRSDGPPPDASQAPERPGRRGRRFGAGLATGIAVSALAVGGVVLVDRADDGDSAATESAPATSSTSSADADAGGATPEAATPPAVTVVPEGSSVHDLVIAVRPSIVAIHTTITQTDIFGQQLEGEAAGSGFVWSADGYIVTNNHVIDGAAEITVTFDDGSAEPAELIAADPRTDLALLKVDRTDLVPLQIGDSDAIRVGDPVVAIGNALDLGAEPTVTGGMVSAKERTISTDNGEVLVHLLQTDAAISSGNSGGPLLDMTGRVVGINTAVAARGQNIGFAIAITPAQQIVEQLRSGEAPRHALLGVSARPTLDGSDGALIAAVEPGSAAELAGIQPGDVITTFDGVAVDSPDALVAAIQVRQPGDSVEIELDRDGRTVTVTAELGAHDEVTS